MEFKKSDFDAFCKKTGRKGLTIDFAPWIKDMYPEVVRVVLDGPDMTLVFKDDNVKNTWRPDWQTHLYGPREMSISFLVNYNLEQRHSTFNYWYDIRNRDSGLSEHEDENGLYVLTLTRTNIEKVEQFHNFICGYIVAYITK